jgi:hypothetical protein
MPEPGNEFNATEAAHSSASSQSGIESAGETHTSAAGSAEVGASHTESIAHETTSDSQDVGQQTQLEDFSGGQKRLDDFSWWKNSAQPESNTPEGTPNETASDAQDTGQQNRLDDYSSWKDSSGEPPTTSPNETPDSVIEGTGDSFSSGFKKGLGDVEKIYEGAIRRDAKTFYEGWKGVADEFGTFIESARHPRERSQEDRSDKNPTETHEKH